VSSRLAYPYDVKTPSRRENNPQHDNHRHRHPAKALISNAGGSTDDPKFKVNKQKYVGCVGRECEIHELRQALNIILVDQDDEMAEKKGEIQGNQEALADVN
jgi:hypothetical protein